MDKNKTTFTLTSLTNSDTVNITAPLNVLYLVNDKYVVDNTNGEVYPSFAVAHKNIYSVISKIDNLINNTVEVPGYELWNWEEWYSAGSMVYTYNADTKMYAFFKALKLTNPLIQLDNTEFWNSYNAPIWSGTVNNSTYDYEKGMIVYINRSGGYEFFECIQNNNSDIDIYDELYWKPLNLEGLDIYGRYNIGTKIHSGSIVYTCIKTVLPVTRITDIEYWKPYFDSYALIQFVNNLGVQGLIDYLEAVRVSLANIKSRFEMDTINMNDVEFHAHYTDITNMMIDLNNKWELFKNEFNQYLSQQSSVTYGIVWKNVLDADNYFKKLHMFNTDPITILESIKYLDSFQELLESEASNGIVVYIKNLTDLQDPAQKHGGYFIYDTNIGKFIKVLVGSHEHRNKDILDEISQSFDEYSDTDNNSSKVLTVRKEKSAHDELSWEYHAQWKDIDLIPDRPTDGKERVLKLTEDGTLEWSNNLSNTAAFIKKEKLMESDSNRVEFEVQLSTDQEGNLLDSLLIFKNSLYLPNIQWEYDNNSKILEVSDRSGTTFVKDDHITLLVVRNTSAEMLSRLSDQYVSKKEAIEILSGGRIELKDYARKEDLTKYSLRNHIHTRYASTDHKHDGIYADYYHNHDGLYLTRNEVNDMIGNILSLNPEVVNIVSTIAADLENLSNTFVTKAEFADFSITVNRDIEDLRTLSNNVLFIDTNTGLIKRRTNSSTELVDIKSLQIKTRYVKDGSEDTYDLEEWLDLMQQTIANEEDRIRQEINATLRREKVIKTKIMRSNELNGLAIDKFRINTIVMEIEEAFDTEINVTLGSEVLIESDDIMENQVCFTTYIINKDVLTETMLRINTNNSTTGRAVLTILGYSI